ncbi:aldehyde dehydrogenase family protein [Niallia oryzisoli]|uniref:Aldehyde dehydrogenase family protein n=1 Tax=Niallia oryzisoli TaxID=1737571 RepID=A0ABZ2CD82_9BACI
MAVKTDIRSIDVGIWIAGQWVETKEKIAVKNKFNGETLGFVGKADKEQTEWAVSNAKETFEKVKLSPYERSVILNKMAQKLKENKEELALILTRETGNTIRESRAEIDRCVFTFEHSAEEAKRITGEMLPINSMKGHENRFGFTVRVPVGVVCAITPFNGPLNLASHKVAPAIAAGNTVVLKPARTTSLSAVRFAELLKEAGLPDGYLNVVFGGGADVGTWLLHDQRIGFYSFTGSEEVGKMIKQETGIRRVGLELGNNSATIVCSDANIEQAAELCVKRALWKAGQVCISVQRVYVHEAVLEQFLQKASAIIENIKVGDPEDPNTDIGVMHTEEAASRIEAWVHEAVEQGARVVCGNKRNKSQFLPTLLTDVKPDMKVVCKEIFAPVVSVIPFKDLDEVIRLVNDSDYGLQAGAFTNDINTAFYLANKIEVGGLNINDTSNWRADIIPYGGIKNSGIGREGPKYAIEEMTELRVITFNLSH